MGLDTLLSALPRLADVWCVVAGDGPERASLERLASTLGVRERTVFTGPLSDEDLVPFYSAIDLLVVPSRYLEGFGLVVLEAMASGTPVLATRVGGLPEAMGPFGHMLVEPGDTSSLEAIIRNEPLWPSAEDVRAYAQAMTWPRTVHGFEGIFESLPVKAARR
jgi:glycosyltransferase involved in cell wall biosynthesis